MEVQLENIVDFDTKLFKVYLVLIMPKGNLELKQFILVLYMFNLNQC